MAEISLSDIDVAFGENVAIHDISFQIPRGQFVSIVGPTGCGKSSVLNLVAGLLKPSSGRVVTGGRELRSVNHEAAYMFQQDALLPWKTCLENVMLGPILRGKARAEALGGQLRVGSSAWACPVSRNGTHPNCPEDNANVWQWRKR